MKVRLNNGRFAVIDEEDYELVKDIKWSCMTQDNNRSYAQGFLNGKKVLMHRLIMHPAKGMQVDHINRDGLDNRRSNLRVCTPSRNQINRSVQRNNASGFKGVHFASYRNRFCAKITHEGKRIFIGFFETAIDAAMAYDKKARELFGEFAFTNFPRKSR